MANFKRLSEVEFIPTYSDDDAVLLVSNDDVKQVPASEFASFDKLAEVETVDAPGVDDALLLVSDGAVKQMSAAEFAAACGGSSITPIYLYCKETKMSGDLSDYYVSYSGVLDVDGNFNPNDYEEVPTNLYEMFLAGTPIFLEYKPIGGNPKREWTKIIGATSSSSEDKFYAYDIQSEYCSYVTIYKYTEK